MSLKFSSRLLFAALFVGAGIAHFVWPTFYASIMPPYLPWHLELVYLSGAAEVVLGVLLVWGRTSRWAAWGLVALLVAVFPANLHMALNPTLYDLPPLLLWLRLPFQGVLIAWAYVYTK